MDYLNELRECCLEAYTGIVQGLKGEDKESIGSDVQLLLPHVPHMINFITIIARDREKSDGTISAAAGLIGYLTIIIIIISLCNSSSLRANVHYLKIQRSLFSFRPSVAAVC